MIINFTLSSKFTRYESIRKYSSGTEPRGVFKSLPNISEMKLSKRKIDVLCLRDGVSRNMPRKITFKLLDRTEKINRYIIWQESRLEGLSQRKEWGKFWKICYNLCRHSACFFAVGLRAANPLWYKDMPLKHVHTIHRLYRKNTLQGKFGITRQWIDKVKPDGTKTYRPLGVPSISSRILYALMSRFITIAVRQDIDRNQHAFVPGKGTNTAWAKVLSEVITCRYIWEFDLRNFFGEIAISRVVSKLRKSYGLSGMFEPLLLSAMTTTVLLGPRRLDKINEHAERWKAALMNNSPYIGQSGIMGLPQGAAISPILSILMLDDLFEVIRHWGAELLMYADDGIVYSNEYFDPTVLTWSIDDGTMLDTDFHLKKWLWVTFNKEKCQWIRKDGVWVSPLKFLGLIYEPWLDQLMAKTRKGATLLFDKMDLIKALNARDGMAKPYFARFKYEGVTWSHLIGSSVYGFVLSRMYSDDWNPEDDRTVKELSYKRSTWADDFEKVRNRLTLANASSYAYLWLINKITTTNNSWTEWRQFTKLRYKQRKFSFTIPYVLLESELDALAGKEFEKEIYDEDDNKLPPEQPTVKLKIRRTKVGMLTRSRLALGYTTPEREYARALKYHKALLRETVSSSRVEAIPVVLTPLSYLDTLSHLPTEDAVRIFTKMDGTRSEMDYLNLLLDENRLAIAKLEANFQALVSNRFSL